MILKQNTLTLGVLVAAFAVSALYQAYRAMLNEVPEYDVFTPMTGVVYLAFVGITALVMTDRCWAWWVVPVFVTTLLALGTFWYHPTLTMGRVESGVMGLVGWLESTVYVGLLFVAGFVCTLHLLGVRLVPGNS
jgi:hypothetical protein